MSGSPPPPPPPPPPPLRKLSRREQRFVDEYVRTFNGTQSAIYAGYSRKTAYSQAYELLKRPEVVNAIDLAMAIDRVNLQVQKHEVLAAYLDIAGVDVRELYIDSDDPDEPPRMREPHELPSHLAAAVSEVGYDARGRLKYKFHSKTQALDSLAKHLGLFSEDNLQRGLAAGAGAALAAEGDPSLLDKARRVAYLLHRASVAEDDS